MKYVIGNWKMAPPTFVEAERIYASLGRGIDVDTSDVSVVICPPFVYAHPFSALKPSRASYELGAQDAYFETQGAHTGEISPSMLKSLGLTYAIVGHSERRALGETNGVVSRKAQAVIAEGMIVIVCVGEASREGDWHTFLIEEVDSALKLLNKADLERVVIAYEPIWAIGAETPDTPDGAMTSALLIRKVVRQRFGDSVAQSTPIIYGGSVNAKNVMSFVAVDGLDGVLVGRASRDPAQFIEIVNAYAS